MKLEWKGRLWLTNNGWILGGEGLNYDLAIAFPAYWHNREVILTLQEVPTRARPRNDDVKH